MNTLRFQSMIPLAVSSNRCFSSPSRSFKFFTLSLPIFQKKSFSAISQSKSPIGSRFAVRNCSSITAKPSSEIRRKNQPGSETDKKLRALRELFSRPGIGIDAYIVPSQDAHQVLTYSIWLWKFIHLVYNSIFASLFIDSDANQKPKRFC